MSSKRIKELENKSIELNYMWNLQNQLFAMFDYNNIPCRKEFIEWEMMRRGFSACCKTEDKILFGSIAWTDYDEYGLPKDGSTADFFTRFGFQCSGTIGKDIVLGYNNPVRTPELSIPYYANMFTEIDKSIKVNVMKSRVSSIPVAKDENTKKAIDNILSDIETGLTRSVASTNILEQIGESSEPITMLHFTQPEQIERVQYLSKLYDDLLRRFWTNYGHSMNSTGKMAQVNTMELEGYETYSMITPMSMLESRKEYIENINNCFGTEYSVDFGRAWKHSFNDKLTEEENNDTI